MAMEAEVVRKVLNIAERELNLEEYARFLAAITPKMGRFGKRTEGIPGC